MDRHTTPPFMVQVFYRTGAFHRQVLPAYRPDEFATTPLPSHLTIHTWPDCTLTELTQHVAAAASSASLPLLPDPAIGTRLAYRLIFADTRGSTSGPAAGGDGNSFPPAHSHSRYIAKDIGSVVVGEGGPALDPNDIDIEATTTTRKAAVVGAGVLETTHNNGEEEEGDDVVGVGKDKGGTGDSHSHSDGSKTLAEARFVPGDFVSCAILPPLPDGSVAPASDARTGRGVGVGEARPLDSYSPGGGSGSRERENEFPRAGGSRGFYGGYGGPNSGDRGGFPSRNNRGMIGGGGGSRGGGGNVPSGEWRRGERLPDVPLAGRPRGRGRW